MKRLFIILITTVITLNIWGAKAYPEPITITQKDGKILTYRLHGDEHFNYVATTDGVLLYQQGMDFYIAVIDDKGNMSSSGVLAHNAGQRTSEEIGLIGKQDKKKFFAAGEVAVAKSRGRKRINMNDRVIPPDYPLFPHLGEPKALVILADFKDQKFKHNDEETIEIFKMYLNSMDQPLNSQIDATLKTNYGSVRKYFSDMSGGLFKPQFDVARKVVHLTGEMKDYGAGMDNMPKFFREVCNLADDFVNFKEYDADNDGKVDLVYVIYAGYGQSTGGGENTIWPKSGPLTITDTFDEKLICRYGVNPELNFSPSVTQNNFNGVPQINGIGLFCHEFTHCMGLADFYPTKKYDDNIPEGEPTAQEMGNPAMEYWDLMDGGEYTYYGYSPTAYTAWEREFMEWKEMEVLTSKNSGEQIELINIDKEGGKAYKIFPNDDVTGNEYVFIQNIQPYGWNYRLAKNRGKGMLVTYVCYDELSFSTNLGGDIVNSIPHQSRMTIVPADGLLISYYLSDDETDPYTNAEYLASHSGDPFPGTQNVHDLYSIPMIWAGESMDKPLLNIQEKNQIVSFYYMFEPAEKKEDNSEINVHKLSMTTESDENQIITEHEWKDAEGNTISTSYRVRNFSGVAFGIESDVVNASDCNILSLCVKPSQAITLNVTLTSETPSTSNSKVALGMNTSTTNTASTYTRSYELKAGEWRTLAVQLSSFAAQGVDLSKINSVTLSLGSEPDEMLDNILLIEDVYFSQSTQRGIATFINQTETTSKDKKVYTLDGRYVGNSTRGLAKGVYIINGKKTVIR